MDIQYTNTVLRIQNIVEKTMMLFPEHEDVQHLISLHLQKSTSLWKQPYQACIQELVTPKNANDYTDVFYAKIVLKIDEIVKFAVAELYKKSIRLNSVSVKELGVITVTKISMRQLLDVNVVLQKKYGLYLVM